MFSKVTPVRWLQASAFFVCLALPASAQTLTCVRPAGCKLKLSSAKPKELLAFRLSGAARDSGAVVSFNVAAGSGTITASGVTNGAGLVVAEYSSEQEISTEVTITARHLDGTRVIAQAEVKLAPPDKPLRSDWKMGDIKGDNQVWYAERQLKEPIEVPIVGPSEMQCDSVSVRFKAHTELSAIAPDTARAKWNGMSCVASARFRLGKEVGMQFARVELIGSSAAPRTISARARLAPRFMVGALVTFSGEYDVLQDSVTVDSLDSPVRSSPMLGVDWAPVLTKSNLRMVLGLNPLDARHEFFLGVSALQLGESQREGVGFDLQTGLTFRHPRVVDDRAACAAGIKAKTGCQAERKWKPGVGVMLSVDAISLLGEFKGLFPVKY